MFVKKPSNEIPDRNSDNRNFHNITFKDLRTNKQITEVEGYELMRER